MISINYINNGNTITESYNKINISKPYFITSDDGVDNACVKVPGYEKPCRGRSSMLILKNEDDTWKVFFYKDNEKDHEYHAPGGGWNKNEDPKDAAIREVKEECMMNVKDVKYQGYMVEYHDKVADWVKDHVENKDDWWYGYYSEIFVGLYDSKFTGKIDDIDKDKEISSGKFYVFDDIKDDKGLPKEYKKAIESYIEDNSYIKESVLINEKDIYYNKDKFDSGEINLCFITGHSGSGKSTMGRKMASNEIEVYELDDLVQNKMKFTMDNMREYGDLFYSFFNGPGKKYWYTKEDVKEGKVKEIPKYDECLINDFIKYAISYANSHKNIKYIIEGVWIVDFCKPQLFKEYAFYIKGTSLLVSRWRAAKRDSQDAPKGKKLFERIHNFTSLKLLKPNYDFEKDLMKFRDYFEKLSNK